MNDLKLVNGLHTRACGILLPVFSLPGPYGIGCLGKSAYAFLDFLHDAGQQFWQILPLAPTSEASYYSPYMSPSAFAGNHLYIDIEALVEKGLINREDLSGISFSEYHVDYQEVQATKNKLLRLAWQAFKDSREASLLSQFSNNHSWVLPFSVFIALKYKNDNAPWYAWPTEEKTCSAQSLENFHQKHQDAVDYEIFKQYLFHSQWELLHTYANQLGIQIIGDLPIYVALDSADVWEHQCIFQLDTATSRPTHVAGVPPDYFSKTGQLWGNPLYKWQDKKPATQNKLYQWWEKRLRHNLSLTDIVRIDHFRGFESYWSVPAEETTAINGTWIPGPGKTFFKEMEQRIGTLPILAEDLGIITPEVEQLRDELGYPGMKILLFAFDGDPGNSYLPHNCTKDAVIYTGTHDNDTAVGWFLSPEVIADDKFRAKRYARRFDHEAGNFHEDLIYLALSSVCNLAILPMQDILGFGNDCRTNTPGTVINNWQWRCAERFLNNQTSSWLRDQVAFFGRSPTKPKPDPTPKMTQDQSILSSWK
ncbi:4-alpha-glucanotransferase [Desulfogranum japonicum]|uniref:4-alpha-glucanotransferase n=1 Tax=Desulfogranum japonicum TaxID=231447 RepID=UPI00040BEC76|nr:4-alpha-glucanotransferase [Desulfogranum japonicum]